jgi:hypothetical protein
MFRRKLIAGVAALTAAASIAIPAASASAHPAPVGCGGEYQCGFCRALVGQIEFAYATHNVVWGSVVGNLFVYSHCGGAAL